MNKNPWFAFYLHDYGQATSDLSLAEDGAYRRLLDHYYMTGSPLPTNNLQLYHVCRAVTDDERAAVNRVVERFFINDGGKLRNPRADQELRKRAVLSEKRRLAVGARYTKPPANTPTKEGATTVTKPPTNNLQMNTHLTVSHIPPPKESKKENPLPRSEPPTFEEIYAVYPKQAAWGKSIRAIADAIAGGADPHMLLERVSVFAAAVEQWPRDFRFTKTGSDTCPSAATWFGEQRWKDDTASWLPGDSGPRESKSARVEREAREELARQKSETAGKERKHAMG